MTHKEVLAAMRW